MRKNKSESRASNAATPRQEVAFLLPSARSWTRLKGSVQHYIALALCVIPRHRNSGRLSTTGILGVPSLPQVALHRRNNQSAAIRFGRKRLGSPAFFCKIPGCVIDGTEIAPL
jgi:hypothetical protein